MINKYDPELHDLYVCCFCGAVSEESFISFFKNYVDKEGPYLKCPVCKNEHDIED